MDSCLRGNDRSEKHEIGSGQTRNTLPCQREKPRRKRGEGLNRRWEKYKKTPPRGGVFITKMARENPEPKKLF
jgi:hypothetical protein